MPTYAMMVTTRAPRPQDETLSQYAKRIAGEDALDAGGTAHKVAYYTNGGRLVVEYLLRCEYADHLALVAHW